MKYVKERGTEGEQCLREQATGQSSTAYAKTRGMGTDRIHRGKGCRMVRGLLLSRVVVQHSGTGRSRGGIER